MLDDIEQPHGWVKPQRKRSLAELKLRIVDVAAELLALQREVLDLEQGDRLEAIVQIRNIMRAQQLTFEDLIKK